MLLGFIIRQGHSFTSPTMQRVLGMVERHNQVHQLDGDLDKYVSTSDKIDHRIDTSVLPTKKKKREKWHKWVVTPSNSRSTAADQPTQLIQERTNNNASVLHGSNWLVPLQKFFIILKPLSASLCSMEALCRIGLSLQLSSEVLRSRTFSVLPAHRLLMEHHFLSQTMDLKNLDLIQGAEILGTWLPLSRTSSPQVPSPVTRTLLTAFSNSAWEKTARNEWYRACIAVQ